MNEPGPFIKWCCRHPTLFLLGWGILAAGISIGAVMLARAWASSYGV